MNDQDHAERREKLEQRLLELIYDLLPETEAAELHAQITSDPEVARVYAVVKPQADLLAAAARLERPPVKLRPPQESAAAAIPAGDRVTPVGPARGGESTRRVANWLVGLAATALVCLVGYYYFQPGSPINPRAVRSATEQLSGEYVRVTLTGPARLHADATGFFQVATLSADGRPVSAPVEYVVYSPAGELLDEGGAKTDDRGRLDIVLPPQRSLSTDSRLEVFTAGGQSRVGLPLQVDEPRFSTQLSFDKPLYRPGETVRYRCLTLSRFGLKPDRELPLRFEILDPAGVVVPDSELEGVTDRGVGNGSFPVPAGFPGGTYTLTARSLDHSFPDQRREFAVRQYRTPRLKKELEFTRDSYGPGDQVVADFSATRAEGGPAADAPLTILPTVDGRPIELDQPNPRAGADGTYRVEFTLPAEIERGSGTLAVVVDDGGTRETIAKTIPINLGKVDMRFYPEGGDLVAGLDNRVYFHAVDPLGKPVEIQGVLVDEDGHELMPIETVKEGRGAFRFQPRADSLYRINIISPPGVTNQPELPRTTAGRSLVMDTGNGVFGPHESIDLDVLTTRDDLPLLATAVCRGVQVSRAEFVSRHKGLVKSKDHHRTSVTLPIGPEVAGVVRVTIHDCSGPRPEPVAERLVYRQPAQRLQVHLADDSSDLTFSPGETVQLTLQVSDETGDPVPAALGVAVVDDALLNLADDKSPQMTTHFLLTTEIEKPEDLEDTNFFLSDDPEAAEALDLLLGTQGWRRFAQRSLAQLGQLAMAVSDSGAMDGSALTEMNDRREALAQLVALEAEDRPPVTRDNGVQVEAGYNAAVAAFVRRRAAAIEWFGWSVLLYGVTLLVALGLMGALRTAADARVWVPAVAVSALCCLVGITWTGAEPTADGQIAFRTWSRFDPAGPQLADKHVARSQRESLQAVDGEEESESAAAERRPAGADDQSARAFVEGEKNLLLRRLDGLDHDPQARLGPTFTFEGLELGRDALARYRFNLGDLAKDNRLDGWMYTPFDEDEELPKNAEWGKLDGKRREWNGDGLADYERLRGDLANGRIALGQLAEYDLRRLQELAGRQAAGHGIATETGLDEDYGYYQGILEQLQFDVRIYAHEHVPGTPGVRTDFAETLYWHPLLIADADGRATIEFQLSDSVTTFRVRADAHGAGRIGSGGGEIVARIPFSIEPKLPLEVTAGDRVDLPVAVNNDTQRPLPVELTFVGGELWKLSGAAARQIELPPATRHREYFPFDVVGRNGEGSIEIRGAAGHLTDAVRRPLRIASPGFPVSDSYAGRLTEDQTLVIPMPERWVSGSLEVKLEAFPSSLADLQQGLDSILREPSGCFEQTSSSNYPNVLALLYMQEHDVADPAFTRRAKKLLQSGYGRLTGFECPQKGYEWFGGDPGHEALTAYGLMEFRDMSGVWEVDPEMVSRTAKWLLDRRDGQGGFQRNSRALDSFGQAPQEITNAYIVWALAEAGQQQIDREIDHTIELARESEDPYLIALAAAAAMTTDRGKAGAELLDRLAKYQQQDGHLEATEGTITRSGGLSMQIETTALAAMAWLKEPRMRSNADRAVEWIGAHRQGSGGFGSTQATILALKALIAHAKANRTAVSSGELFVRRGDDDLGRTEFGAGETKTIVVEGLEAEIRPGENELTIGLTGENEMPYLLDVSYHTYKPASDEACPVRLKTTLASDKVAAGASVGLAVELSNISGQGQPMTVAIVGLPAGLEARVDRLDELKEAGEFDFYEINARELIFYWRSLSPEANGATAKSFDIDLIAEIPGHYTAPASRAYLYYTPEQKHWVDPLEVEIDRE